MNQRPYKLIRLYCDALDYYKKNARDTTFINIIKDPDSMVEGCDFSLMNFRGWVKNGKDSIISIFQPIKGNVFPNCYVVTNVALDLVESENDIERIYVSVAEGIVAFQSYRGDWWIRQD